MHVYAFMNGRMINLREILSIHYCTIMFSLVQGKFIHPLLYHHV